jgi:hypothetical protein
MGFGSILGGREGYSINNQAKRPNPVARVNPNTS